MIFQEDQALPPLASKDPLKGIPGSTDAWGRDRMIDMARHMDVAMAGLNPSTWRLFSDLKLKLCFYLQQSCRLTFIQRDVVILESSAAETTTIQGTITFMVVDTGTSYQSSLSQSPL